MGTVKLLAKQKLFLRSTKKIVTYIGGIGAGKTFIGAEKAVLLLLKGAYIVCTASSYKQLKLVLFQEIKDHLRYHDIPFTEYKADMVLDIPSTGGKIYGFSSDSIESVRGITADVAIMDEAALQDKYVYDVIMGRLRRGVVPLQIFLITTPRGKRNWLYKLVKKKEVDLIHQPTSGNLFLPSEYTEMLELEYSGDFAKQELAGEFVDGEGYEQLISILDLNIAGNRFPIVTDEPLIAGLDVARYGDDSSAIVGRKGNEIQAWKRYPPMSQPQLEDEVLDWVIVHKPICLVIDGCGLGSGVVDHLIEKLKGYCDVLDYNGAHTANKAEVYTNARSESWGDMADWIKADGCIKDLEAFECICDMNYFIDKKNRKALESKEVMKRRKRKLQSSGNDADSSEGLSPDIGDALSMTFADKTYLSKKNADKIRSALDKASRTGRFSG
jgi:hypothetical protein